MMFWLAMFTGFVIGAMEPIESLKSQLSEKDKLAEIGARAIEAAVKSEARLRELEKALREIYEAAMSADARCELDYEFTGEMLDMARALLTDTEEDNASMDAHVTDSGGR